MKKLDGIFLNEEQAKNLENVLDFILEFEETDYVEWQRETGRSDGHVYYEAKKLWDEIFEDERND